MSDICIQPLFVPELCGATAPLLYFRGDVDTVPSVSGFIVPKFASVSADTYFNSFPIGKWKQETALKTLKIRVNVVSGSGVINVFHRSVRIHKLIQSAFIENGDLSIDLEIILDEIDDGILYWQIGTLDGVNIADIRYVTADRPVNDVRLGIAVPSFHRDAETKDLMMRFDASLMSLQGHKLFVIDNGGTLSGEHVVANTNAAGGTGGYTRGILLAQTDASLTHVLLMDDDAPSSFLSVEKCAAFLKFVKREDTAVAGAMLVLERPDHQYGTGLKLENSIPTFSKPNRDMTSVHNLLVNEAPDGKLDAGGWYFFAFPISRIKFLPFPYFVRGDDVLFCIQNDFNIVTISGVCCWQTSFEDKITPSTTYLAYRARLLNGSLKALRQNIDLKCVYNEVFEAFDQNVAYLRYGHAGAILDAVEDVLKGPYFFKENPSAIARLNELVRRYQAYYPTVISEDVREKFVPADQATDEDPVFFLGFACPTSKLPVAQDEILFWSSVTGTGFLGRRSELDRDSLERRKTQVFARMESEARRCFEQYEVCLPELQSVQFWHNTLGL